MRVVVYVEGPSDRLAMQELLRDLLELLRTKGVLVQFVPAGGKAILMKQVVVKALNILRHDPDSIVVALPDLYPPNIGIPHQTDIELVQGLQESFAEAASSQVDDERLRQRFQVFCFKHDLEALVLAAESQLASRLGVSRLEPTWIKPVENQDMNCPPKRIVEDLFRQHRDLYVDTIDAPLILGAAQYTDIAAACPQQFKPFVSYLESLL